MALLALIALALRHSSAPSFEGVPLRTWITRYHGVLSGDADPAKEAISSIGTNANPFLVKWIRYEETPLLRLTTTLLAKLPLGERLLPMLFEPRIRADEAANAFLALEASASNAVPALIHILTNSSEPETSLRASRALAYIGKPAIPGLVEVISDDRLPGRERAIGALALMQKPGTNGLSAVPVLVGALNGSDPAVRQAAALALGHIGLEPESVVPALVRVLDNSDFALRLRAAVALGEFREQAKSAVPALLHIRDQVTANERVVIDIALANIDRTAFPPSGRFTPTYLDPTHLAQ
jgi:HEAT repeat protein